MSSTLGLAHTYYSHDLQVRIGVILEIPTGEYGFFEAMTRARSTASRTKHRMLVYPVRNQVGIDGWRIKIGKGPLA